MQNHGDSAAAELEHAVLLQPATLAAIWAQVGELHDLCDKDKRALRLVCKRMCNLGDAAVSKVNTRAGELHGALTRWRGVKDLQFRLMGPNDALLLLELSCASLPRLRDLTIYQGSQSPAAWSLPALRPAPAANLRRLICNHCFGLQSIKSAVDFTRLRELNISDCENVTHLPAQLPATLLNLRAKNCSGISDLGPLRACPLLGTLDVAGSGITDLGPLRACTLLKELDVSRTRVTDLSPLQALSGTDSSPPQLPLPQLLSLDRMPRSAQRVLTALMTAAVVAAVLPRVAPAAEWTTACDAWARHSLSKGIQASLAHWQEGGISEEHYATTLRDHGAGTSRVAVPGVGVLLAGGQAYLTTNLSKAHFRDYHMGMITAHLILLQDLASTLGDDLPHAEFVFGTGDAPAVRLADVPSGQPVPGPVLRFCTSDYHADVPVPYIHFQMRGFGAAMLAHADDLNRRWPWGEKQDVAFGRFTTYARKLEVGQAGLARRGARGSEHHARERAPRHTPRKRALPRPVQICAPVGKRGLACNARAHFMAWAASQAANGSAAAAAGGAALDVASRPKVSMHDHASYRYLVHLDGQSCSSRLEQLLVMGSVVLKEESGYRAFYHHLLAPYGHYLPFWVEQPEDILDALGWAQANSEQAQRIASRAQALAREVLTGEALACYWRNLVAGISRVLGFVPSVEHARARAGGFVQPVAEWLASEPGVKWTQHYKLDSMELPSAMHLPLTHGTPT
ncbi:hypothetical protein FOA52_006164 [Chlamydomonas sp. UWO 241]|nr:hypothetical protein FOA52_006164 [Chlamydomonas sp. UWO 241]